AAPGAGPDHLAETEAPEALGEGFPIGPGAGVAEHDQMPPEGALHVPDRVAHARLPVEPRLAQQLLQEPGVDVAAAVVANVDHETLAVEDGIELPRPLRDVLGPHGPQVHVPDLSLAQAVHLEPSCVLPL